MRAFAAAAVLFSCVLGFTRAAPTARALTGCNISNDVIPLPPGQTALIVPSGNPVAIALGLGTQNYSCSAAGTYTSIGAVATLFDASCFFDEFQSIAKNSRDVALHAATETLGSHHPIILGHHFFVKNPTGAAGLSPTFDFRSDSEQGNPNAFVITSKSGDIPSPYTPTTNVDWLELTAIPGHGDLANNVFRIFTLGGQPPKSCTPGSAPITVPYAANYWFYK